jgi:hypothetical protein
MSKEAVMEDFTIIQDRGQEGYFIRPDFTYTLLGPFDSFKEAEEFASSHTLERITDDD